MSLPSKEMLPEQGEYHRSSNPIMVLFPDPDGPFITELTNVFNRRYDLAITHHQRRDLSGRDMQGKVFQNGDIWTRRISEVDAIQLNGPGRVFRFGTRIVKGVDLRVPIDESEKLRRCGCRAAEGDHVWCYLHDRGRGHNNGEENTVLSLVLISPQGPMTWSLNFRLASM